MEQKRRSRRDFLQNIVIVLLSLSALLLFAQTQLYNLGDETYAGLFSATGSQVTMEPAEGQVEFSVPVRIAVSGPYGRYGSVTMETGREAFAPLGRLMGEVIGSAKTYTVCDEEAFLGALKGTCAYYDFLNPLPLSVLAGLAGGATADDTAARLLTVAADTKGVGLYLWDGAEEYRRYSTAVTAEALESAIGQYELGNVCFAFEGIDQETELEGIAPYALFMQEEPLMAVLTEEIPSVEAESLLAALQFNPNTKSRYTESSGTEVIVENGRTLRLRTDGRISYHSGGDPTLSVSAAGDTPTLAEIASEGSARMHQLLTAAGGGQGTLYLQQMRQTGPTVTLTYGYEVNGVPVRFVDGENAGSITLSGTTVTALELRLRRYTATEEETVLLPLRQAAAIAKRHEDAELFIGYVSDGNGRADARWLVE
ncbi:MAG: hypothetical protein IKU81_07160 [Oscillibacter sp.]|nr:hypothetical protein [Oscillibacter sp.]